MNRKKIIFCKIIENRRGNKKERLEWTGKFFSQNWIVLAIKDNKYFDIQVKSTVLKEDSTISHQIKLRSYDRHNRGSVFYIIVIRSTDKFTNKNYYLVFSTETINRYVKKNYMKASNEVISIKVYQEKGRLLLKNGVENEDITECINNFEIIK